MTDRKPLLDVVATQESRAKQATPHPELIARILDSRVPKTEQEHAAAREIFRLQEQIAKDTARIAVLEEALQQIAWSNDSAWQSQCAKEALEVKP